MTQSKDVWSKETIWSVVRGSDNLSHFTYSFIAEMLGAPLPPPEVENNDPPSSVCDFKYAIVSFTGDNVPSVPVFANRPYAKYFAAWNTKTSELWVFDPMLLDWFEIP